MSTRITVAILGLLTACAPHDAGRDGELDRAERELRERIAGLQAQLDTRGRGAYRQGSTLAVGDHRRPTALERLHEVQERLAATRDQLEQDRRELREIRRQLAGLENKNARLERALAVLDRAESKMQAAIQEAEAYKRQREELAAELRGSELRRLRAEHAYFSVAKELIGMRLDETQRFIDLREHLRLQVQSYRNGDHLRPPPDEGEGEP